MYGQNKNKSNRVTKPIHVARQVTRNYSRTSVYGHPEHQPYAYQAGILRKRFFTNTATYGADSTQYALADLNSALLAQNNDNSRLGDTVVFTGLEVQGTMQWGTVPSGSIPEDNTLRVLVCASIDNNGLNPLVDPNDPLSSIDNTKVPAQCTVLWDSHPCIITPRASWNGTSHLAIDHHVHRFSHHQDLRPQGDEGVWTQYSSDGTLMTGRIYALFISDSPNLTDYNRMTFSFALEFKDVVKSITSQLESNCENLIKKQNELVQTVEQLQQAIVQRVSSPLVRKG
jgi:hypothetical protein